MFRSCKRYASTTAHTQGHHVYPAVGKWSVIENSWTPPGRNGERNAPRNLHRSLTSAVKLAGSFWGLTEIRRWLNFNWLRSWTLEHFSFQKSQRMRERLKRRRKEGVCEWQTPSLAPSQQTSLCERLQTNGRQRSVNTNRFNSLGREPSGCERKSLQGPHS